MAGPKLGSCHATQIKARCHYQKGKGGLKYANLQDKYILILLEYKLMPELSDWTLWGEPEWTDAPFTFLNEVLLSGTA